MKEDSSTSDGEFERPYISAVVESLSESTATVLTSDNQKITIPKDKLPKDASDGMRIRLIISSDRDESVERELLAKSILNEILNGVGEEYVR